MPLPRLEMNFLRPLNGCSGSENVRTSVFPNFHVSFALLLALEEPEKSKIDNLFLAQTKSTRNNSTLVVVYCPLLPSLFFFVLPYLFMAL